MSEDIVILYPPSPIIIDSLNINYKKEIEIYLYNKTINNVLYKINSNNNNDINIENSLAIIKPFSSQSIKLSFINNIKNGLNEKYDVLFNFYILNNDNLKISNLNKIYEEIISHQFQKKNITILLANKTLKGKNEEEKYYKDIIQKYSKLKSELNEINNKVKNIIELKSKRYFILLKIIKI